MSATQDTESGDPGLAERARRTVTPAYWGRPDAEMNAIGWTVFLGVLVLLVPLLPFIVLVWLISKAIEAGDPRSR